MRLTSFLGLFAVDDFKVQVGMQELEETIPDAGAVVLGRLYHPTAPVIPNHLDFLDDGDAIPTAHVARVGGVGNLRDSAPPPISELRLEHPGRMRQQVGNLPGRGEEE